MNAIYSGEIFVDMSGEKLRSEWKFRYRMKNKPGIGSSVHLIEYQVNGRGQTYYGALNCQSGQVFLQAYSQGNTANTIKFVEYLRNQYPQAKLVLI